jgi:hypothetical protein
MEQETEKKKQMKMYVTFRENEEETELFKWIEKESKVGGVANYFKRLALRDKQRKEQEGK